MAAPGAIRDVRERLIAFYKKYNPERLPDVDKILFSYRGNEDKLFAALLEKYAPYGDPELEMSSGAGAPAMNQYQPATPPPPKGPPPQSPSPAPQDTSSAAQQPAVAKTVSFEAAPPLPPPPASSSSTTGGSSPLQRRARRASSAVTSAGNAQSTPSGLPPMSQSAESVIKNVLANPTAPLLPAKVRTRSLIEVTDASVQQAHAELHRISDELSSIDPLVIQRRMTEFIAAASKLSLLEATEEDERIAQEVEAALVQQQSKLVGIITQLQHAISGFLAVSDNVVSYSQQQSELQALRALREAEGRRDNDDDGGGGASHGASSGTTRFAVSDYDQHYHQSNNRPTRAGTLSSIPGLASGGASSSMLSSSPGRTDGGANASVVSAAKVVFDVFPLGGERNVVSDVILNQAAPGDVIVLHPGEYFENLVVQHDIEIRCAIDTEAVQAGGNRTKDTVIVYPADPSAPTLQVVGDGRCRLSGIAFRRPREATVTLASGKRSTVNGSSSVNALLGPAACVPLVSCSGHSNAIMRETCFIGGGGGLVCLGHAEVTLHQCTFRQCTFGGIYAKDASFVSVSASSFIDCDVALRVREATFSVDMTEARGCTKDAFVCHGSAKGLISKTKIDTAAENGILLSPSCEVVVAHCLVTKCGKYGVYAPIGADFAFVSTVFTQNALGDASRTPPLESALLSKHNLT